MKKIETSELALDKNFDICISNPLKEIQDKFEASREEIGDYLETKFSETDKNIAEVKKELIDIVFDSLCRRSDESKREITFLGQDVKTLTNTVASLQQSVDDVDFRRTEFEIGDDVLAKSFDGKKYKRGKIVGFGTGRRILVATMFGHLIANEHDTFLVKRQPKDRSKK